MFNKGERMNYKEEIKNWLTSGTGMKNDLLDMVWNMRESDGNLIAENPKLPYTLFIEFHDDFVSLVISTGIETALLDSIQRLDFARKLLILNDGVNFVKFALSGENEEIVLKIDLDLSSIDKKEFGDALMAMVTSLYLMIREFKLEEEFSNMVRDHIIAMINEKISEGLSREELLEFLIKKVGLDENDANKILDELIKKGEELPEYR